MPGPRAAQNLQMPRSYPAGALGAAEIDWCIITDALVVLFAIGVESHRLSFMLKKRRFVFWCSVSSAAKLQKYLAKKSFKAKLKALRFKEAYDL